MNEVYEELVSAIISQTMEDYVISYKKIKKLEKKLDKMLTEPQEPIVQREGEKKSAYKCRKYRHTPNYIRRLIAEENENLENCKKFLTGNWIKKISNIDGLTLLEECNRRLEEKGYKVDR